MWWRGISSKIVDFCMFRENRQPESGERLLFGKNGWSESSALTGKSMKQWTQIMGKKIFDQVLCLLELFCCLWNIFVPFPCPNSCFCMICTLSALSLKIGSEIPSWKHNYFLNCVLPFKNRFLLDHVMLFYATQRPCFVSISL